MRSYQGFLPFCFICSLLFCLVCSAQLPVTITTIDAQAKTLTIPTYGYAINGLSFQQEALWTFNGWQYAAYYNGASHVCVARRQLPAGAWSVAELTDYTQTTTNDAHNVVTLGICPNDGTIHLSFDHHGGQLHYRLSIAGVATNPQSVTWSASLFGPMRNYLISGSPISSVTYPRFWPTPDGDLQFGYRDGASGNGDWYMADYTAATGLWSDVHQVINRAGTYSDSKIPNNSSRNAYMNSIAYGPDGKLHVTWCWRESATGYANHDIMYACSEDGGNVWYNGNPGNNLRLGPTNYPQTIVRFSWLSQGPQIIGTTVPQLLITLNSPGVNALVLDSAYGLMNQQAQAIDPQGRVHVMMFHCNAFAASQWGTVGERRYNHYWRDSSNVWHHNELPFDSGNVNTYVGSRPKLFIGTNGDAYMINQSWQSISLTSTSLYIQNGDLVIWKATAANQWTDWQIVHVQTGPFLGEALGDPYRFQDGVLSVLMQNSFSSPGQSTPLRVFDFQL